MINIFNNSKNEFHSPENKYYIEWSSKKLSKYDIAKLHNEIGNMKLCIMAETNTKFKDGDIKIFAITENIGEFIDFTVIEGDKSFIDDELIVNEKFAKDNNLKIYDEMILNDLNFKIVGIYKSNSLKNLIINYDQLSSVCNRTSIQQKALISSEDGTSSFTSLFESFFRKNNIDYSIYNHSSLMDLIVRRKSNSRNANFKNMLIGAGLLIFGIINIVLVIGSKIIDDDKNYIIMKCLGAKNKDISTTFMADIILCFSIANILLVILFPGLLRFFKLNEYVDWDFKAIVSVVGLSFIIAIIVGYMFLLNIHSNSLADGLKGEK